MQTINPFWGLSACTDLHTPTHPYLLRCMNIISKQLASILMAVHSHYLTIFLCLMLFMLALHQHNLEKDVLIYSANLVCFHINTCHFDSLYGTMVIPNSSHLITVFMFSRFTVCFSPLQGK